MAKSKTLEAEWKTRKGRIDRWLKSLPQPWEIVRYKDGLDTSTLAHHAIEEFPTANEPVDYALFVDGKLLNTI